MATTMSSPDVDVLVSTANSNKTSRSLSFPVSLRTVLLDAPLLFVLAAYASVVWLHHIHDAYLGPQLEALKWTEQRQNEEMTYYQRSCDAQDISTHDPLDLIMDKNATAADARQSTLKHGFAMFQEVLQRDTATQLRNYVVGRNKNISTDFDAISGLHEPEYRQSISLNTDEPIVRKALMEVGNHEQLSAAAAAVLGDDPALVEISTITNAYGAVDQNYHPDLLTHASATRYARSFSPTFSIFFQLQDTTAEMGATSACPGTHACTDGDMKTLCEEEGFQVLNEDGIWPAGDAVMMYSNTFHRGSAHRDPNALDRVMLVLIFTAKPQSVAESRQVSSGLSGCWDAWGFTWNDMKQADTVMVPPLTYLRSLGLYKPPSASWGISYLTISAMRLMQEDWVFDEMALKKVEESGGLSSIPVFLQGRIDWEDDIPWQKYLLTTFLNVKLFVTGIAAVFMLGYASVSITLSAIQWRRNFVCQSARRLALIGGAIYLALLLSRQHVDSTQWAKDIRAGRRYASTMDNEADFVETPAGPTAYPNRHDVLIEHRYSSAHHLAMQSDYINDAHRGNIEFHELVEGVSSTYADYPELFRNASARYIVGSVAMNHGRFLEQGLSGFWHRMEKEREMIRFTRIELAKSASPRFDSLMQGIRQAIGSYRFGIYRDAALASKHMVPYLRHLESRLLEKSPLGGIPKTQPVTRTVVTSLAHTESDAPVFQPPSPYVTLPRTINAKDNLRSPSFVVSPREPTDGAWLESGDLAEAVVDGHWYACEVSAVSASGLYHVSFSNGDEYLLDYDSDELRRFQPYQRRETVGYLVEHDGYKEDDDAYEWCEIVSRTESGRYNIVMENDEYIENVDPALLRREYKD